MAKIMCRYFKLNGYYLVTNNTSLTALTLPWSVLNDVVKFLISNNDI